MYVIVHQYSICNHGMFIWEVRRTGAIEGDKNLQPQSVLLTIELVIQWFMGF